MLIETGIIIRGAVSPETEKHIREGLESALKTITASLRACGATMPEILFYGGKGR